MAYYGYTNEGNSGSLRGRFGDRFQSWSNAYGSNFTSKIEAGHSHVCRPIIIGADGKAIPGVIDCPHDRHRNNNQCQSLETQKAQEFMDSVQCAASECGRTVFPGNMFKRASWPVPPEAQLTRATNDARAAADCLTKSAGPPSVSAASMDHWRSQSPYEVYAKKNSTANTIDSREAAKKYGGQFMW